MIKVLVISIATPILIGIYKENKLIKTISKDGKTSDILPTIFKTILSKYEISEILYVNGPGSFMSIKVSYLFLKTISITNDISFKATNGFYFNDNSPIKALGKKYFFKDNNGKITTDFLKDNKIRNFTLPNFLTMDIFSDDILPSYNLPVVS
jgi:tRNA A37 threonylcarbamoyladenosine modification protein TsaB